MTRADFPDAQGPAFLRLLPWFEEWGALVDEEDARHQSSRRVVIRSALPDARYTNAVLCFYARWHMEWSRLMVPICCATWHAREVFG